MPSQNNLVVMRSTQTSTVWVLGDRRSARKDIVNSLINGSCSVYYNRDAARRDAFQTEKVWEIKITASEV